MLLDAVATRAREQGKEVGGEGERERKRGKGKKRAGG